MAGAPQVRDADAAPGDRGRLRPLDGLRMHAVAGVDDPVFDAACAMLWGYFGAAGEMEPRRVIAARLARPVDAVVETPAGRVRLVYGLLAIIDEATGELAAVRDHTVIAFADAPTAGVVVHLSHALVAERHRGGGLGGWLRTLPVAAAWGCAASWGVAGPVTLAAEMEHPGDDPASVHRLKLYERAGFTTPDPRVVDYRQPDFREGTDPPTTLPLRLVLRRCGLEHATAMSRRELRTTVAALYAMYGADFTATTMREPWSRWSAMPDDDASVALLPPTRAR